MQIITDYRLTFAANEIAQVTLAFPDHSSLICRQDGTLTYTSEDLPASINTHLIALPDTLVKSATYEDLREHYIRALAKIMLPTDLPKDIEKYLTNNEYGLALSMLANDIEYHLKIKKSKRENSDLSGDISIGPQSKQSHIIMPTADSNIIPAYRSTVEDEQ